MSEIKITRELEQTKNKNTMHKFIFEDGTVVPFDEFKTERQNYMYCGQPSKIPGQAASNIAVYVSKELYDFERKQRYERNVNPLPYGVGTQIGILMSNAATGIPAGSYVPLRWNNAMRRFDVYISGLLNDKLILDKSIASANIIAEVEKAKKTEVVED